MALGNLKKQRILEDAALFQGIAAEVMDELQSRSTLITAKRRERVIARVPSLYIIGSGRVRLSRPADDQRDITVAYLGPGDVFGECRVVDRDDASDGVATEAVEALAIPLAAVDRLVETDTKFTRRLLTLMGRRRAVAERRVGSLLTQTVASRVVSFLLDAGERHGVRGPSGLAGIKLTHQEIASYVGATRETVTLILGDLKRAGCVRTEHRRVVIVDRDELAAQVA